MAKDMTAVKNFRDAWDNILQYRQATEEQLALSKKNRDEQSFISEVMNRRNAALRRPDGTTADPETYLRANADARAHLSQIPGRQSSAALMSLNDDAQIYALTQKGKKPPQPEKKQWLNRSGKPIFDVAQEGDRPWKEAKEGAGKEDKVAERQKAKRIADLEQEKRGLEAELSASGVNLDKVLAGEFGPETQVKVKTGETILLQRPLMTAGGDTVMTKGKTPLFGVFGANEPPKPEVGNASVPVTKDQIDPRIKKYLNVQKRLEAELETQGIPFTPARSAGKGKGSTASPREDDPLGIRQ